jgi:hypothetical protein
MNDEKGDPLFIMKGINLTFVIVSNCGMEFKASCYDVNEAYTGNKKEFNFFFNFVSCLKCSFNLMVPTV